MAMAIRTSAPRRDSAGFTLIELMVTVVIATILITVAIPSYSSSIRKSRRTEAKTTLLDLAGREERYFNTNNVYSVLPSDLGYSATAPAFPMTVGSGYYQVNIALTNVGGNPGYTITAVPITPDQLQDTTCLQFQLTNTGAQTATDPSCWQ
jgi:type IV pilus assembly protein PilE